MAENEKWHLLSGAIQATASVYCAIWGTWTYYHPLGQSAAQGVAQPSANGGIGMPLPLYIGILVLSVSVGTPAIIRLVSWLRNRRKNSKSPTIESIQAEFKANFRERLKQNEENAKLSRAQESLKRCEEDKRQLQLRLDTPNLFTPLQVEAFQLSKDIIVFLEEIGKRPEPNKSQYGYDPKNGQVGANSNQELIHSYFDAKRKIQQPWILKSESIWRQNFEDRVEKIVPKFGVEGMDATGLRLMNERVTHGLFPTNAVFEIAKNLIYLAHGLDTRKVVQLVDEAPK